MTACGFFKSSSVSKCHTTFLFTETRHTKSCGNASQKVCCGEVMIRLSTCCVIYETDLEKASAVPPSVIASEQYVRVEQKTEDDTNNIIDYRISDYLRKQMKLLQPHWCWELQLIMRLGVQFLEEREVVSFDLWVMSESCALRLVCVGSTRHKPCARSGSGSIRD